MDNENLSGNQFWDELEKNCVNARNRKYYERVRESVEALYPNDGSLAFYRVRFSIPEMQEDNWKEYILLSREELQAIQEGGAKGKELLSRLDERIDFRPYADEMSGFTWTAQAVEPEPYFYKKFTAVKIRNVLQRPECETVRVPLLREEIAVLLTWRVLCWEDKQDTFNDLCRDLPSIHYTINETILQERLGVEAFAVLMDDIVSESDNVLRYMMDRYRKKVNE